MVGVIEVCFSCLATRCLPDTQDAYRNFLGLARLCQELGLPLEVSLQDLKAKLEERETGSHKRKPHPKP